MMVRRGPFRAQDDAAGETGFRVGGVGREPMGILGEAHQAIRLSMGADLGIP